MLTRRPLHEIDSDLDVRLKAIEAVQATNTATLATAVAALQVLKDAGLGATDGQIGTVLALFTTATVDDTAVAMTAAAQHATLGGAR